MSTSYKLLERYFTQNETLNDYVSRLLPEVFIELPDDPPSFVSFLNTTIVAYHPTSDTPEPVFDYFEPTITHADVRKRILVQYSCSRCPPQLVKKAQTKLLRTKQRENILTLGFRFVMHSQIEPRHYD